MASLASFFLPQLSSAAAARIERVRRVPLYIESRGEPLFAWLHLPESQQAAAHGVLICPPIGHEQIHAHRSLRHLADAFAKARYPVLRFDYHGTGDSPGCDEDPNRVATWLANVRDAHAWLRQQFGCRHTTIVGLRAGAALAVRALEGEPIDELILWAPVIKGRAYVREMKALSLTASTATPLAGALEAAGFVVTDETQRELSTIDLLQYRPACERALIVMRDDAPHDSKLLEHLQALGIQAEQTAQPGYADMMAEPHCNQVPQQAIAHMVAWLGAAPDATMATEPPMPGELRLGELVERPVFVSEQPSLFGILTTAVEPSPKRPWVLLVNAGSAYRAGPNRLYVLLARQFASRGFPCLRLDLSGLGDSVCADAKRENDAYPATAFRDIDIALRYLHDEHGAERVVLMGLCSGAYAAFQSAAQLANPLLVESVLINPLTYFWCDGMQIGETTAMHLKTYQECLQSAWQPRKWLKLVTGQSKLGIRGALKVLLQRWRLRAGTPATPGELAEPAIEYPTHPAREDLPGDLERIRGSGRHLTCFFSRSDPGYGLLTLHAADKTDELRRAGVMTVHFLDQADHTFSQRTTRQALTDAILDHLTCRHGG